MPDENRGLGPMLWVGHNPDPWDCSICGEHIVGVAPRTGKSVLVCQVCDAQSPGINGAPYIPLTIAPRKLAKPRKVPRGAPRWVVSINGQFLTSLGEMLTPDKALDRIRPRTVHKDRLPDAGWREQWPAGTPIFSDDGMALAGWLHDNLCDNEFFGEQIKLISPRASPANPDAMTPSFERMRKEFARFGYASTIGRKGEPGYRRSAEGRARWYPVISPKQFTQQHSVLQVTTLMQMGKFADEYLDFVESEGLRVGSTPAALASQFARDARFWPGRRRKMPAADNARVRPHMPGNYYKLLGESMRRYDGARKIDVTGSHHQIAMRTRFPAVNTFRAYGLFRDPPPAGACPADIAPVEYMTDPDYDAHGMFCVNLWTSPEVADDPLALPCMREAGERVRYIFSNELPDIWREARTDGCRILGCYAQWTSPDVDDGLNEYAHHALARMQTLERGTLLREWAKTMFHSLYGQLASRPRHHASVWVGDGYQTGEEMCVQTDEGFMNGRLAATKTARESPTTVVMWRAMIEAGQRLVTLRKARELRAQGAEVLLVHSDSLIFLDHNPNGRPEVDGVWRDEGELTNLIFVSATEYVSDQEDKLPGIKRGLARAERRRLAMSATGNNDGAHLKGFASGRSRAQFTDALLPM
jgi:hypothetical protein